MNRAGFLAWMSLRVARWVICVAYFAYVVLVMLDRSSYMDEFSRPLRSTEAWLFGLPLLFIAIGLLELMVRDRAGIARPDYFRFTPPKQPA
ncbi:hypothetical protein JQ628_18105 [Bradyrhizobium lablabi]|uniref:hypothetical protein n=1 Tax=Bradyrhizobium lablabi TaxID=722472 RepID=UPI001BA865D7|nr:hypothetical protein [Bradyrhizobium lablabi]MBR1123443.1 hypothetical protein [Bradyrhizobium lablabi]